MLVPAGSFPARPESFLPGKPLHSLNLSWREIFCCPLFNFGRFYIIEIACARKMIGWSGASNGAIMPFGR
jgi:hypothetical protein